MSFRRFSLAAIGCLLFLVISFCISASAQSVGSTGTIQGKVTDAQGAVVVNAKVELSNSLSGLYRTTNTDAAGSFVFYNVPQNPYRVVITANLFAPKSTEVDVRTTIPIDLPITLQLASANTIVEISAQGELLENEPSAHVDVDTKLLERIPMEATSSNMSQLVTLNSPLVAADSNGFFHAAGDHAQTSFNIDGQNVSDQQSRAYSNQISSGVVESVELITGVAPAEYGDKTSLVGVITTKSGLGLKRPTGSIDFGLGSFNTPTATLNLGVGNDKVGNFISINGMETNRFLDPQEFQSIHNRGNSEGFFDHFDYHFSPNDTLHLNISSGRSWFQIPNSFDQAATSQDQRQKIVTYNLAPSYTHTINANMLLSINGYVRHDTVDYYPSSDLLNDQPETVGQHRTLLNLGLHADLSYIRKHHTIKAGFQFSRTSLQEQFKFGVTDPTVNPVCLDSGGDPVLDPTLVDPNNCTGSGFVVNPNLIPGLIPYDLTRGGTLFNFKQAGTITQPALYVQDNISYGNFNISLGVRGERYQGLVTHEALEPRVGASYRFKTNTVIRASYGRTFETPYNENLLLSNAVGGGGSVAAVFGATSNSPLEPGKRDQFNAGFQQEITKNFVVDGDYFWKYTKNAYDFNTLGNTPITFPIAWAKSKLDGFGIRFTVPNYHGLRINTTLGHTRARYFNPEVGGLFFDQNPPTGVFRIDHDQALQSTTNVQYSFDKKRGGFAVFTWRYDSGLVAGAVPFATDTSTPVDLTGLTADQQIAAGLFCGGLFPTLSAPLTTCAPSQYGSTRIKIPAPGTEDDDHNPPRIAPRNLFDAGMGFDNIFRADRFRIGLKVTAVNIANKVALYNFLSTFSGTHFVTPRSVSGGISFSF